MRNTFSRALSAIASTALLGVAFAACGGGSSGDGLFGAGDDASAGSGGGAGSGGASGSGGSGGVGGKDAAGGTGGSGGVAGSGGSGGSGGAKDASVDVSVDASDVVCASTAQCIAKLGGDVCKTNLACSDATATCTWKVLDKDGDGHPPVVCGGDDCDDSSASAHPGATEICDGHDNDCDGAVDDGATCGGLRSCTNGACVCPAANTCGADCVDKATDAQHCGDCAKVCPSGSTCQSGNCVCSATSSICDGSCVDTKSDPLNCNGCGNVCASGYDCANGACTCLKTSCSGACVDTTRSSSNCGGCGKACPASSSCQSSTCVCNAGLTLCGSTCADLTTSTAHCGGCNQPCAGVCQNGQCQTCTGWDVFLFVDLSGSMATPESGTGHLDWVRGGVSNFVGEAASSGLGVGIGYFPYDPTGGFCGTSADCNGGTCLLGLCLSGFTDSCKAADYPHLGVAIQPLPAGATAITNSISAQAAVGGTPATAFPGAMNYARSWAANHPGHKTAIVVLTDGVPNECGTAPTIQDWVPAASTGYAATPRVLTYVVALDSAVLSDLSSLASAGGTGSARLATSSYGVQSALDQIRSAFKTCP